MLLSAPSKMFARGKWAARSSVRRHNPCKAHYKFRLQCIAAGLSIKLSKCPFLHGKICKLKDCLPQVATSESARRWSCSIWWVIVLQTLPTSLDKRVDQKKLKRPFLLPSAKNHKEIGRANGTPTPPAQSPPSPRPPGGLLSASRLQRASASSSARGQVPSWDLSPPQSSDKGGRSLHSEAGGARGDGRARTSPPKGVVLGSVVLPRWGKAFGPSHGFPYTGLEEIFAFGTSHFCTLYLGGAGRVGSLQPVRSGRQ